MEASSKVFLKDLTSKIGSGATPRGGSNAYKDSGISLIRSQNIRDFKFTYDGLAFIDEDQAKLLDNVAVLGNDILLNITGDSIARACLVPQDVLPARVNQHVSIIRCKDKDEADYVLCYLQYLKKHLLTICKVGGTRNALTKEVIENIEIRKVLNHKIRGKLITQINAKIELNNRINRQLEAMAKTLYDYWFVQFDFPFDFAQGKPNEQGKPYKSSGGKMVYNEELKREIPEGWEKGCFNDLGEIIGGSTPSRNNPDFFTKKGIAWITPNDLANNKGNKFISKGEFDITIAGLKDASLKILPKNSILLSSRAPVGYMAITREEVTTNQGFKSFISNKGYPSSFIYYAIKNSLKLIEQNSSGSTFKEISGGILKTLPTLLPNKDTIEKYRVVNESIFKKQDIIEQENQQLASLRDWLLPMLMNGQVTVKEAEEKLDMAAEPIVEYAKK
jgi:type I restriction enzyme, S subunit